MVTSRDQQVLERAAAHLSRAAAALSLAVGFLGLIGWLFGIEWMITISPAFATMKVNTAVAFILAGFVLWKLNNDRDTGAAAQETTGSRSRACRICMGVITLLGLLTLCEYIFGCDLGIDNLLVQDHHDVHNPFPGRMSRVTALNLVLLGVAFLTIDLETRTGKRPAQWLGILMFLDSYVAVLGYIYGVDSLYSVGGYASTALQTACLSFLVAAGFLLARAGKGLMQLATDTTAGGWIFRTFLPFALLIVPLIGWIRLQGEQADLYSLEFGVALMVIANVVVLCFVIWWLAGFVRHEWLNRTEVELRMETNRERAKEQAAILEERVRERTVKLEEAMAELERSTYTISHNLRAPVRAILAFADFLTVDCGDRLDHTARNYLERIKNSATRMDRLIEGVLAYSRVSRSELKLAPVDLDALVDSLAPDYASNADIRITHPLGTVRANEFLLEQAISNLLENAAKFVRPGTTPQIEVWSEPQEATVRLTVHDHGIGVPEESGDKIFRTFERAHGSYAGTGIGLAIVKRSAERMDGRVGFESKAGEGSWFWMELPKAEVAPA